jgi:hypothetical protein
MESSLPEVAVTRSESHFAAKHRNADLSAWIPAVL